MVTQPHRRQQGRRSLPAVGLVAAIVCAGCGGSGASVSGPAVEPQNGAETLDGTAIDPAELPESFDFSFTTDTGDDATASATDDIAETVDAPTDPSTTDNAETTEPTGDGEPHPLESTVIDTVVVDEQDPPFLDEAGALACANTEMALDAIIEGTDDLDGHLDTAAEWASQSEISTISAYTEDLASLRDGSTVEDLVVAVLGTCATVGYEL